MPRCNQCNEEIRINKGYMVNGCIAQGKVWCLDCARGAQVKVAMEDLEPVPTEICDNVKRYPKVFQAKYIPDGEDAYTRGKEVKYNEVYNDEEEPVQDNVNHPSHYTQGGIECIDAINAMVSNSKWSGFDGMCLGNALKYMWRFMDKNGKEDLKKAVWYIERCMKEIK